MLGNLIWNMEPMILCLLLTHARVKISLYRARTSVTLDRFSEYGTRPEQNRQAARQERFREDFVLKVMVNERVHEVDVDPDTPLLYVLTDNLKLKGPRFGCGLAQCGSCSVLLDGQDIRSCV